MDAVLPRTVFTPVDAACIPDMQLAELLGSARDVLVRRATSLGLTLCVCDDWAALEVVNQANLATWTPMLRTARSLPSFWVAAIDAAGQVVATSGCVLADCSERSFAERLQSMDLTYDDPDQKLPGEMWFVGGGSTAFDVGGRVVWTVAGWNHPARRGQGLFHLMCRTARLESWVRWEARHWVGVVEPKTVHAWAPERAGRRHLDDRPTILYVQPDTPRPPLHFLHVSHTAALLGLQDLVSGSHEA